MQITKNQIEAAYLAAKLAWENGASIGDGVATLERVHKMNSASADNYIRNFFGMMEGREFRRTMNAEATDYFLGRIHEDFGTHYLRLAIDALRKHADYYERVSSASMKANRRIIDKYEGVIDRSGSPSSYADFFRKFETAIAKSLADSSANRKKRLQACSKMPKKIIVLTESFIRNPDVVAEVLARANGICERCRKPAPFIRAKDGTPYLEIHHMVQLADGGEDTVENAFALCPNCHRELHFGKSETKTVPEL